MKKTKNILIAGFVALATMGISASAQNLQSVSSYRKAHADMLARQNKIQDQIKVEETQRFAQGLYDEVEPEPDIYTEGWDSGLVNPYNPEDVPNTKVIELMGYKMPVDGNFVTSHYGYRPAFGRYHKGVDLRCAIGDTVRAAFSGKVRLTKFERSGFGFYVILRHENGLETVYGHLSRFLVKPDQYVEAGTPIALSGNTGRSTGPHLHFETRYMGYAINPEAIFNFENRVTRGETFTFNKSTYQNSKSYSPKQRYTASTSRGKSSYGSYKKGRHSSKSSRYSRRNTYTVQGGDNLSKIAKRNGVSVAQLKKMNGIKGNKVRKGKVLRVK